MTFYRSSVKKYGIFISLSFTVQKYIQSDRLEKDKVVIQDSQSIIIIETVMLVRSKKKISVFLIVEFSFYITVHLPFSAHGLFFLSGG